MKRRRAILARRVFVEEATALAACDMWKRDGLTLGVRPKWVKVCRRAVSCDGVRHVIWFVIAYGAFLPLDNSGPGGEQCRQSSGDIS